MKSLIILSLSLCCASIACAQTPSTNELKPEQLETFLQKLPAGDVARGENIHKQRMCAGCHGAEGVAAGNNPSLAGQPVAVNAKSLMEYRDGWRTGPGMAMMMANFAKPLKDQDIADLAAYYASKPIPSAEDKLGNAPSLVLRGDRKRLITPCASCHGTQGKGSAGGLVPYIAGQNQAYLDMTLKQYRADQRHSDVLKEMRAFTKKLTDEEISALSQYYSKPKKQ